MSDEQVNGEELDSGKIKREQPQQTFASIINMLIQGMNKIEIDMKAVFANLDVFDKRMKLFEDRLTFITEYSKRDSENTVGKLTAELGKISGLLKNFKVK